MRNVVILNIDADNKRISLGLKQAQDDPWLKIGETYPVGTELDGSVVRLMDKGVVVDIGNDIEGFVPVSQLNFGNPVDSPADMTWEGMKVGAQFEKRRGPSMRAGLFFASSRNSGSRQPALTPECQSTAKK